MARAAAPPETGAADKTAGEAPERPTRRRAALRWVVVGVVVLAILAVGAVRVWGPSGPAPLTQAAVNDSVKKALEAQRKAELAAPPDAASAHQAVQPSLVYITTQRAGGAGAERGTGAGVVIKSDGTVLTALHVVEGVTRITTRFADGTEANAKVVSQQPANDIAVLSVDKLPQVVVPAVLGGGARVGDAVFAVGHPLGLADSLTAGVVSALGRSVRVDETHSLKDLIQFDAAVNPGNSGGPLVNRSGQVVGIVTGLANPSEQSFFVGIGFAVPIATAGGAAGSPQQ